MQSMVGGREDRSIVAKATVHPVISIGLGTEIQSVPEAIVPDMDLEWSDSYNWPFILSIQLCRCRLRNTHHICHATH